MEDAEERGEASQARVPPEHKRFALCIDGDDDQTGDESADSDVDQTGNGSGMVSVARRGFIATRGGIRGVFADLESAYVTQGGELIHQDLIQEFDSLEAAEQHLKGGKESARARAESCYALMFLDGGDGFAMRMSSWDESARMDRNHPDAVFMLYSDRMVADVMVQERRDVASGLAFEDERRRQAALLRGESTPRNLSSSGLVYQHSYCNVSLGPLMKGTHT